MIRPDLFRERGVTAADHKGGSVTRGVYSVLVVLGRVCEGGCTMRPSSRAVIRNHASADRRLSINKISSCKRSRVATCDLLTGCVLQTDIISLYMDPAQYQFILRKLQRNPRSVSQISMDCQLGGRSAAGLFTAILLYTIRADHCRIGPFCCP